MNNVCNFLNDKSLIILTSVISSLTTLVVVFLFKSFVLKTIKLAAVKSKTYVKKLYRWHKGKPTIKELMDIERRQKAGKSEKFELDKAKQRTKEIGKELGRVFV